MGTSLEVSTRDGRVLIGRRTFEGPDVERDRLHEMDVAEAEGFATALAGGIALARRQILDIGATRIKQLEREIAAREDELAELQRARDLANAEPA